MIVLFDESKKAVIHCGQSFFFTKVYDFLYKVTSEILHELVIVITIFLPNCRGQETAKGSFGLRVKLPLAHLSITHGGDFALFL